MHLDGRIVLVTGASSGIGSALVRTLALQGCQVLATGRREDALEALSMGLPSPAGRISSFACELDKEEGRRDLVEWVGANVDHLDLLFNNAGIQRNAEITPDLSLAAVEQELAINLIAPIMLTANLVPLLEKGSRAVVVNVSSGLAIAPKAKAPVYCASKAALSNFSLTLRWQLEPRGIGVVDVVTPLVKTPMTEGRNEKAISAEDFASELVRRLDGPLPEDVYIEKTRLLRLLMRIAPRRARGILRNS